MTTEYSFGKFKSSSFCVFANRLLALIVAFLIVTGRKFFASQGKKDNSKAGVVRDVPFYYYAPSSLSNTISSWAQYEALKYVSFPVQVISKSCKIIPVMLVSFFLT
jgi:adenosine 3'-phospho 5'-phosphosulfate transporter B2